MTSVQNVSAIQVQQPLAVLKKDNVYSTNFKAGSDQFVRQPSYAEIQREREKQIKKQNRRQNVSMAVSIGAGLAIIASVLAMFTRRGGAANELKELTDVPIKWTKFTGKDRVAPLASDTTHQVVQEECGNLVSLLKLSPKAKKRAGIKDRARIYYIYGESGTGKSYCVKQTAQEMGAYFTSIRYGEIGSPYKDAGSMKTLNMLRNIKNEAKANPAQPYVVCIDEGDALVRKVSEIGGGEASKGRSSFLTGIDELVDECPNVSVFITSNYHPNSKLIDQASLRRVHYKIPVPLADNKQADAMLKLYLKDIEGMPSGFYKSAEYKAFVDELVQGKYSNGEIESIAKNAADKFGSVMTKVAEADIDKQFFKINYLKEAKELYGQASAITNDTMLH